MSPRDRILARRAHFIAAVFVGITGCSDGGESSVVDANPEPCLSQPLVDTGFERVDASETSVDSAVTDARDDAADTSVRDSAADTGPMPCLVPPLDSGSD